MSEGDNRQIARDSLMLLAELRLAGETGEHRIKVRNLSSGGMMGEGVVQVARDTMVAVNLRNLGWVEGAVAWVQENRFGVAFTSEIDPKVVRGLPATAGSDVLVPDRPRPSGKTSSPNGQVRKLL